METGYECKECGASATVGDGIRRSCHHTGTVIATMKATAYGMSYLRAKEKFENRSLKEKFTDLLSSALKKMGMR